MLPNESAIMTNDAPREDLASAADERRRLIDVLMTYTGRTEPAHEAIQALDDEGLRAFGLDGGYLNLLRLFGRDWPLSRIRETARAATRDRVWSNAWYRNDLVRVSQALSDVVDPVAERTRLRRFARLQGWRDDPLPALLAEGRGVVIACFCVSGFKHVPIDLGLLGYTLTQPAVTKGLREAQEFLSVAPAFFSARWSVVDVQAKPAAWLTVARALKRGALVNVNIDGVTRTDSNKAERMWSVVPFAGVRVRALNSTVRLAGAAGATVLPLLVPRTSVVTHRLMFGSPIRCPAPLSGDELEGFVQRTMETLYLSLGDYVLANPAEWAQLCRLHHIRVPDPEPDPAVRERAERPDAARTAFMRALADRRGFRLDERRIARTEHAGREAWVDVYTLRAFVVPDVVKGTFDLLRRGGRVSTDALGGGAGADNPSTGAAFCAELWLRGALLET